MSYPLSLGAAALAIAAAGCGPREEMTDAFPVTCPGEGDYAYADVLVEAPGAVKAPSAVNVPENAVNGVHGHTMAGSLDVLSRGLSTAPPNNYLVLRWSDRTLVDVEGPDFVVFENAFITGNGQFMDQAVVSVSEDGDDWHEFPHDYRAADEEKYEADPELWVGFAGVTPVNYDSADPACLSPLADAAGGDRFDLADLSVALETVRYVRLVAAPTLINPDTDSPFPKDVISDGFDLDGIYAAETTRD